MAYLRYKELTNYFYFYQKLDTNDLPKYVTDYVFDGEKVILAYKTKRDKGVFTNKRILLFDVGYFLGAKEIYTIPYNSISTISISFRGLSAHFTIYMDSGYPITLKFISLTPEEKTELRKLYYEMTKRITD